MRIGVNARVLLSSRMEGVCRYMHETLKRMVLSHPQDEFYFFFDRPFDSQFVYADNVKPIVIGPPTRHPFLWYYWFEKKLPKALDKYEIDVFYSGDTYMSLSTPTPTVLVSHDIAYAHYPDHIPWLKRKYYQKYFPLFHKKAEEIITVSDTTKDDIKTTYNLDGSNITTAYNSVKEGIYKLDKREQHSVREKYTDGSRYFIYVGSIHPRKNVDRVIQAFDLFKRQTSSDLKLVLVGRLAWNTNDFNRVLKTAEFKNDIILLEGLYNKEVNSLTSSAEGMVYISLFEGFGLPIVEAMAVDVPVITSNISSMPEVAGDAAILVNPKDLNQIASAMKDLTTNEDLKNQLIKKGRRQIESFSWDHTASITYNVIQNCVTKS